VDDDFCFPAGGRPVVYVGVGYYPVNRVSSIFNFLGLRNAYQLVCTVPGGYKPLSFGFEARAKRVALVGTCFSNLIYFTINLMELGRNRKKRHCYIYLYNLCKI
jgi:hypothetical protein